MVQELAQRKACKSAKSISQQYKDTQKSAHTHSNTPRSTSSRHDNPIPEASDLLKPNTANRQALQVAHHQIVETSIPAWQFAAFSRIPLMNFKIAIQLLTPSNPANSHRHLSTTDAPRRAQTKHALLVTAATETKDSIETLSNQLGIDVRRRVHLGRFSSYGYLVGRKQTGCLHLRR